MPDRWNTINGEISRKEKERPKKVTNQKISLDREADRVEKMI